jgi:hypothetical protein
LPALPAGDAAARAGDAAAGDAAGAGVVPQLVPASLELAATLLESSSLVPPASVSSSAAAMSPALSSSLAPVAVLVSSAASSSLAPAPPRTLTPPPRLPSAAAAAATSSLGNASSYPSNQSASCVPGAAAADFPGLAILAIVLGGSFCSFAKLVSSPKYSMSCSSRICSNSSLVNLVIST